MKRWLVAGGVVVVVATLLGTEYFFLQREIEAKLKHPKPQHTAPEGDLTLPQLHRNLPPPERLSAFIQHPIFFEGRQLPPTELPKDDRKKLQSPPPPKPPPKVTLVAILETPETGKMALLQSGKVLRVRLGDEVEGWRVVAIEHDRVVLEQGGKRQELLLFKKRPERPPWPLPPLSGQETPPSPERPPIPPEPP